MGNLSSSGVRAAIAAFTALCTSVPAVADGAGIADELTRDLERFLHRFHEDTPTMMDHPPVILDENGSYIRDPEGNLREGAEPEWMGEEGEALDVYRDRLREVVIEQSGRPAPRAQYSDEEAVEWTQDFVYPDPKHQARSVLEMDRLALSSGGAAKRPWDDSYWPMYKGHVARRYADGAFPDAKDWSVNHAYVLAHPASAIFAGGSYDSIKRLSAAEKYDILVGDREWNLSRWAWREGKKYFERYGKVWSWMGICHGWAGASHMLAPVVEQPLDAYSADGRVKVKFYPSDIRGLTSLLWAEANPRTRFMGSRCKPWSPVKKDEVGRITTESCFDVNPGVWHLATVNQLGLARRSFVIDTIWDYQVWNYPTAEYKYTYFNPQSLRPTEKVRQAIVPIENYTVDKFRRYRSPKARYVVGVSMYLSHLGGGAPSTGTPTAAKLKTVRYVYDLELDENYNVLGGEWYANKHPDFIWTFEEGAEALAYGDKVVTSTWDGFSPIPADWREPAWRSSQRGEPMAKILKALVSGQGVNTEPAPGPVEE